jgi:hypothetical protein
MIKPRRSQAANANHARSKANTRLLRACRRFRPELTTYGALGRSIGDPAEGRLEIRQSGRLLSLPNPAAHWCSKPEAPTLLTLRLEQLAHRFWPLTALRLAAHPLVGRKPMLTTKVLLSR